VKFLAIILDEGLPLFWKAKSRDISMGVWVWPIAAKFGRTQFDHLHPGTPLELQLHPHWRFLRYSNKIEPVGVRKCPVCRCLTKNKESDVIITNIFVELAPHHGGKTAGIDAVW